MEERIWHKAYAPEAPPSIDYEDITLHDALERSASKYPEVTALIMMGKKISYRELNELVNRFAGALADLGIRKGDKVALILPNMPQTVIATYAIFRIGAVVVMNNPLYTERELAHQLGDSDSKLCICMDLLVPRVKKIQEKTKIEAIIAAHIRDYLPFPLKQLFPYVKKGLHRKLGPEDGVYEFLDIIGKYPPKPPAESVESDDLAALLYTGGTTGLSKGVMLSHRNCSVVVQQMDAWFFDTHKGNETQIAIFPFFHVAGFTAMMNFSLYSGFSQILVPRPDPDTVLKMTNKFKPSYFGCVPTIYVGLLNHPDFEKTDISYIKGCISGSRPSGHGNHSGMGIRRGSDDHRGLRYDRMRDALPREPVAGQDQGRQRRGAHPGYGLPHRGRRNRDQGNGTGASPAKSSSKAPRSCRATTSSPKRRPTPSRTGGSTPGTSVTRTKKGIFTSSTGRRT